MRARSIIVPCRFKDLAPGSLFLHSDGNNDTVAMKITNGTEIAAIDFRYQKENAGERTVATTTDTPYLNGMVGYVPSAVIAPRPHFRMRSSRDAPPRAGSVVFRSAQELSLLVAVTPLGRGNGNILIDLSSGTVAPPIDPMEILWTDEWEIFARQVHETYRLIPEADS